MKITQDEYQKIINDSPNETVLLPVDKPIFPVLDPRVELPNFFPNIEQLKQLGDQPYEVEDWGHELYVRFPGGVVEYYFETDYGYRIPCKVTIFGVQTEVGRPAINTEEFNTEIILSTVNEEDEIVKDGLYYQIPGGPLLKIDVKEGETEIRNDWWGGYKRN